jgi:hypothetical protein
VCIARFNPSFLSDPLSNMPNCTALTKTGTQCRHEAKPEFMHFCTLHHNMNMRNDAVYKAAFDARIAAAQAALEARQAALQAQQEPSSPMRLTAAAASQHGGGSGGGGGREQQQQGARLDACCDGV